MTALRCCLLVLLSGPVFLCGGCPLANNCDPNAPGATQSTYRGTLSGTTTQLFGDEQTAIEDRTTSFEVVFDACGQLSSITVLARSGGSGWGTPTVHLTNVGDTDRTANFTHTSGIAMDATLTAAKRLLSWRHLVVDIDYQETFSSCRVTGTSRQIIDLMVTGDGLQCTLSATYDLQYQCTGGPGTGEAIPLTEQSDWSGLLPAVSPADGS